ncbi:hypothetical protein CLTEP_26320 [Clostridium tepidiprofundi DSM 19306]|uniref:Uncharacterized protein n=1 Tax=Clostridium tepidiprofundi DSM 19306 TaxID=1121338 RepID=A0A151AS96_9CLOT|nr:hypothetical protein [Clostridium tepidiprofundi]KYH30485.1 hypothetical protein CLTEP_26320 [Clostridium tepidiprofundi DSM 19306]
MLYSKSFRDIFIDFQKEFLSLLSTTVTIGVSNVGSIYDIKRVYEESKQALKNKLYLGNNSIIKQISIDIILIALKTLSEYGKYSYRKIMNIFNLMLFN